MRPLHLTLPLSPAEPHKTYRSTEATWQMAENEQAGPSELSCFCLVAKLCSFGVYAAGASAVMNVTTLNDGVQC